MTNPSGCGLLPCGLRQGRAAARGGTEGAEAPADTVTACGRSVRGRWLVGCHGYQSLLRLSSVGDHH